MLQIRNPVGTGTGTYGSYLPAYLSLIIEGMQIHAVPGSLKFFPTYVTSFFAKFSNGLSGLLDLDSDPDDTYERGSGSEQCHVG